MRDATLLSPGSVTPFLPFIATNCYCAPRLDGRQASTGHGAVRSFQLPARTRGSQDVRSLGSSTRHLQAHKL